MDAFVFQADLYCADCTAEILQDLEIREQHDTGDSGDYPQGPYADGAGESDTPQHCAGCGDFLQNPLTDEGFAYVTESVKQDVAAGVLDSVSVTEWAPFYGIDLATEEEN